MSKSTTTKAAVKTAPKTAAKAERRIGKAQVRILAALAKSKTGELTVAEIAERAEVPSTWVSGHTFKAGKGNAGPALAELGFVKEGSVGADRNGEKMEGVARIERTAIITAAGKKELAKHG